MRAHFYYVFSLMLFFWYPCYAQVNDIYHLDNKNGLPSNLAYNVLVDHYGYLWIATAKGVVRYNGYSFKVYNYSDGLGNQDIWQLKEDNQGRVWLLTIANQIGYVKNGLYRNLTASTNKTYYPREFTSYKNGILFLSPFVDNKGMSVCIEAKDTLYTESIMTDSAIFKKITPFSCYISNNKKILILSINGTLYQSCFLPRGIRYKAICNFSNQEDVANIIEKGKSFSFGRYIVSHNSGGAWIRIMDYKKGILSKTNFRDFTSGRDTSYHIILNTLANYLYIIGENYIYKVNDNFKITEYLKLDSSTLPTEINGSRITYFQQDRLWGNCIATYNKGVFIKSEQYNYFKKVDDIDLSGYTFVGDRPNNINYWFNSQTHKLLVLANNKPAAIFKYPFRNVSRIIKYNNDTSIVQCFDSMYWINNYTGHISNITGKETITPPLTNSIYMFGGNDAIIYSANEFYILTKQAGITKYKLYQNKIFISCLNYARFSGIAYDSARNLVWAYNKNNIVIFDKKDKQYSIPTTTLNALGIYHIEKILFDRCGDIFLQEYDKLSIFNPREKIYKTLLQTNVLDGSQVKIHNGILYVVGNFGIAFYKLKKTGGITDPVIYPNAKNIAYNEINDFQVSDGKVLVKTDQGVYMVDVPGDSLFYNAEPTTIDYRIIIENKNNWYKANFLPTLTLNHGNEKLLFDVINPSGNGQLKFKYYLNGIDSSWHNLNANELYLPTLIPGRQYTLSLIAQDNIWRSKITHVLLYIPPYWWEKKWGRNILWGGVIMLSLLLISIIVFITRRVVTKNAAKKNLLLELELKSIYSQINPHFIFNSLNSALSFIKMRQLDEAFMHISKFSKLLRAYIKSSRNKFISVEEEIINLRNYIELQQTRFRNKFDFEIIADRETFGYRIPSLLLQPLVENAVNHGLLNKENKGFLKIQFNKINTDSLICIIDDDGIGRMQAKRIQQNNAIKEDSYGTQLINDLINLFNKYENMQIQIEYTDKQPPLSGTTVAVSIKYAK